MRNMRHEFPTPGRGLRTRATLGAPAACAALRPLACPQLRPGAMINTQSHTPSHAVSSRRCAALLALGALLIAPVAHAGDLTKEIQKSVVEPEPQGAKIDLLLNVEFADKYVTPRGQVVR